MSLKLTYGIGGTVATASFAERSITSSFFSGSVASASFAQSASVAVSSSYALSASFVTSASFSVSSSRAVTSSYALTASYLSGSIETASFAFTASLAQSSSYVSASYAVVDNLIVKQTASIAFLNVTYESSSVIYSSGSNQFGDDVSDVQTLFGTVIVSGSMNVSGSISASRFEGTASYALQALSASHALTASFLSGSVETASFALTASFLSGSVATASYALSASVLLTSASYATTGSNRFRGEQILTDLSSSKDLILSGSSPLTGGNGIPEIQFKSGSGLGRIVGRNVGASQMSIDILDNASSVTSFALKTSSLYSDRVELKDTSVVVGNSFIGTFTGSFSGSINTASFALTASFAFTASFLSGSIESASYAKTASLAITASYLSGSVESASYAKTAATASYMTGTIQLILAEYADDIEAASNGVPVGGLYRNGNFVIVRIS